MMYKLLLLTSLLLLGFARSGVAQNGFEEWDKNYKQVDLLKILKFEQKYADSIETVSGKSAYYNRIDKYRIVATFLGERRDLQPEVLQSMQQVFKMYGGEPDQLKSTVKSEYLFQAGNTRFWAPVQQVLEKPLKKEIRKGEMVTLYCLFLNEHSSKGLFNTLVVSEFHN